METEKELRNKRILDLHNSGSSMGEISKAVGLGKTSVHNILNKMLKVGETAPKEPVKEVELKGNEERFTSFTGWERTNVNEYSNKETGEVVRIAFVKATEPDGFGYFVRVGDANGGEVKSIEIGEKKSDPADDGLEVVAKTVNTESVVQ